MRGRKPSPTGLKLLKGERKSRINRNEPEPPPGDVNRPTFVKGYRPKKLWDYYASKLELLGVLKSTDVDMFGGWCCLPRHLTFSGRPELHSITGKHLINWNLFFNFIEIYPTSCHEIPPFRPATRHRRMSSNPLPR